MCANRKQKIKPVVAVLAGGFMLFASAASAQAPDSLAAGGAAIGDSQGGITDRAYVAAPPNWSYVIEKEAGSFLDCGEGLEARRTDQDGRDMAELTCGVTLTETVVIPAASASARLIIHY